MSSGIRYNLVIMNTPHDPPLPDAVTPASAAQVLRQFRVVFNAVKTHFQQVEKASGIGGAQVWALSEVAAHPGMGTGELARAMDIHQSTASNLVKALVTRRLLRTERDERDRRAVHLFVTEAGLETLARAPTPFSGVLPDALNTLDEATLARMNGDLAVLIKVLGGDTAAAQTPLAQL